MDEVDQISHLLQVLLGIKSAENKSIPAINGIHLPPIPSENSIPQNHDVVAYPFKNFTQNWTLQFLCEMYNLSMNKYIGHTLTTRTLNCVYQATTFNNNMLR